MDRAWTEERGDWSDVEIVAVDGKWYRGDSQRFQIYCTQIYVHGLGAAIAMASRAGGSTRCILTSRRKSTRDSWSSIDVAVSIPEPLGEWRRHRWNHTLFLRLVELEWFSLGHVLLVADDPNAPPPPFSVETNPLYSDRGSFEYPWRDLLKILTWHDGTCGRPSLASKASVPA